MLCRLPPARPRGARGRRFLAIVTRSSNVFTWEQGCCKRAPTPDPSLHPSQGTIHALSLPERHSFGFPIIAVSSELRSSLQNLHIKCLHSTLLWGFRVHTETGAARNGAREGNPPAPATLAGTRSTSRLSRLLGARQAVLPPRATSPAAQRGWGYEATPNAPWPLPRGDGPPRPGQGKRGGCGQRHRHAPPLGMKPPNTFVSAADSKSQVTTGNLNKQKNPKQNLKQTKKNPKTPQAPVKTDFPVVTADK